MFQEILVEHLLWVKQFAWCCGSDMELRSKEQSIVRQMITIQSIKWSTPEGKYRWMGECRGKRGHSPGFLNEEPFHMGLDTHQNDLNYYLFEVRNVSIGFWIYSIHQFKTLFYFLLCLQFHIVWASSSFSLCIFPWLEASTHFSIHFRIAFFNLS